MYIRNIYRLAITAIAAGVLLVTPATTWAQADAAPLDEASATPTVESSINPLPDRLPIDSQFMIGRVTNILSEERKGESVEQRVALDIKSGPEKGKNITVERYFAASPRHQLAVGQKVIVNKNTQLGQSTYYVADFYRLSPFALIALIFGGLVVLFARWKGLTAIAGLLFSLLVLIKLIVPPILAGANPLLVSFGGAILIAIISLYLAHGFTRQTTVALIATLITLFIALIFALLFVWLAKLSGVGSEEAFYLQLAPMAKIDLRGLLLGGIIIGALGVLDDITTAQVAAVAELRRANSKLTAGELYQRGLLVGREHIVSLVNTLVLAYVGAGFPLLLLFAINSQTQPAWVAVNSEVVMEEIIRTLVGSVALIFAVPIATALAAYYLPLAANEHKIEA